MKKIEIFPRIVFNLANEIDAHCAPETRDAIAQLVEDWQHLEPGVREAVMAICSELFLRVGVRRR